MKKKKIILKSQASLGAEQEDYFFMITLQYPCADILRQWWHQDFRASFRMVFHLRQLSNLFGQLSTYSTLLYQKSVRYGSSRFAHPLGKFRQFASVWSIASHRRRRVAHEDFPLDLRRIRNMYLFIIQHLSNFSCFPEKYCKADKAWLFLELAHIAISRQAYRVSL